MFSFFYDLALFLLFFITFPKWIWQILILGKYRRSLSARLGFKLPAFSAKEGQKVIWIHTVSMGETRAVIPLFHRIRAAFPDAAVILSTTTETGNAEAKRSMPEAAAHFFLPLDFSWIIRRLFKRLKPSYLLLCESDFWYHLLKIAKERGVHLALVNGKMSEVSCHRFRKFPFFAKRLFSLFDILCVQNPLYRQRFASLGVPEKKLVVTGNLKFDAPSLRLPEEKLQKLRETLCIEEGEKVLVIGSTHQKEEEWLISVLSLVWQKIPHLKTLLFPRHPERFDPVFQWIKEQGLPVSRFSKNAQGKIVLVDAMGFLNQCYQIADVAIVGGSFVSHVGGHNIFEPVLFGVPVFFGPHMQGQIELKNLVLEAKAGRQLSLDALPDALIEILSNPKIHAEYANACQTLAHSVQGASLRTFQSIFNPRKI